MGTPNRIRHILGKLVDNAIKFTDQGRIGLGLEARPSADGRVHLRLAVADTGIGMGPETQARLFHPFEIADATTQRRHAGIGLGLAFSKRLAEGMGGHIEVASEAGVGSTFTLCLDLVRADDASDPDGPGAADADIGRLVALLEQDDIEAIEAYAELSPALRGRMGERYADLERAMANFDFSAAALLLREWQHPAG
ncbi:ATP-binding protein [Parasulfuritortus cantonensis]|uniref:ATP-binding protein n=1 Tax=Parasulfuritortus cantonensis TaxID=2528202 RepID=UPI001404CA86|nr:ATP-binding protein [Parasulfuritortus cantonensis]